MGPGREPEVCENEELVSEFEIACRAGDYEFADEHKKRDHSSFGVKFSSPSTQGGRVNE